MPNKIRTTLGMVAVVAVALAVAPPTGAQVPVSPLDSFQGLAGLFNLAQGTVRIVSLVSPTCPVCVEGVEAVHEVMADIENPRLRAFFVFMPMLEADDRAAAEQLVAGFKERRAVYMWDQEKISGEAWKDLVGLSTPAWDVYFVYGSDATFTKAPSKPDFWMHQHKHIDGPMLDAATMKSRSIELLRRLEQRQKARQAPESDG